MPGVRRAVVTGDVQLCNQGFVADHCCHVAAGKVAAVAAAAAAYEHPGCKPCGAQPGESCFGSGAPLGCAAAKPVSTQPRNARYNMNNSRSAGEWLLADDSGKRHLKGVVNSSCCSALTGRHCSQSCDGSVVAAGPTRQAAIR